MFWCCQVKRDLITYPANHCALVRRCHSWEARFFCFVLFYCVATPSAACTDTLSLVPSWCSKGLESSRWAQSIQTNEKAKGIGTRGRAWPTPPLRNVSNNYKADETRNGYLRDYCCGCDGLFFLPLRREIFKSHVVGLLRLQEEVFPENYSWISFSKNYQLVQSVFQRWFKNPMIFFGIP